MRRRRLRCAVLVCGDPDTAVMEREGGFDDWFARALDAFADTVSHDLREAPFTPEMLAAVDVVVISGSPHSVYDPLPWIPAAEATVREAVAQDIPVLGVCFGHQLIAQAMGGRVVRNPRGREMGTIKVNRCRGLALSPLLEGLDPSFEVQATHRDTVIAPPPGAEVFAQSVLDDCHGLRVGCAWGVQFHPEITPEILRAYVRSRDAVLRSEGRDPDALHDAIRPTPAGQRVLINFLRWAEEYIDEVSEGRRTA